ncbi:hypothetical protein LV28_19130 [Pandoraea pnomenusa]|uniref:Uncharacterized protein n=1 Tax=Pandoraea pnomenusa TaxID=93220 RepID=A0A378YTP8_9BURK|nr:hypothetical protein [Pandoraea pnomenusa]AIU28400.1 hypothetical protein LV28_19130 [Pandoraea pnomenusa]SUA80504.1 Uncharacterised protein [Pandoraea pnomenusa]
MVDTNTRPPSEADVAFFVADDIRPEAEPGKLMVVGLMPGNAIRTTQFPTEGQQLTLPSLAAALLVSNVSGQFSVTVDFRDPNGKQLIAEGERVRQISAVNGVTSLSMVFPFRPLQVVFGDYQLTATISGQEYVRKFSILGPLGNDTPSHIP